MLRDTRGGVELRQVEGTATNDRPRANNGANAVLLDEHPIWLGALERLLCSAGVAIAARATAAEDALRALDTARPELFVTSIDLSNGVDGVECVQRARDHCPELRIVALSGHANAFQVNAASAAGADVCLPKTCTEAELLAAVAECLAGNRTRRSSRARDPEAMPELTPRELEILHLVARGYTNVEIAERLWVTKWTVKFHLVNAYRKLGVSNRTQASRYIFDNGLSPVSLDRSA
jgi:DNA-binding NarL/FixJ family response regulator